MTSQDKHDDTTPTPEFIAAFEQVTGRKCSPANVIACLCDEYDLFNRVEQRHAEIVASKLKAN